MEFKGTKGEWKIKISDNILYTNINTETHRVCEVKHYNSKITELLEPTKEEGKANALLISKAPEMLELLIEFSTDSDGYDLDYLVEKAQELIKQATEI